MSLESPNLSSLDRWAFDSRRVPKPWGWELIWAQTDHYLGKVLFVKAGESLSLQFHRTRTSLGTSSRPGEARARRRRERLC